MVVGFDSSIIRCIRGQKQSISDGGDGRSSDLMAFMILLQITPHHGLNCVACQGCGKWEDRGTECEV